MKNRKEIQKINNSTLEIIRLMECFLEGTDRLPTSNISMSSLVHLIRNYIEEAKDCYDQTLINRILIDTSKHQTLIHSVNVMQLSVFLGLSTWMNDESLERLAIAALLHDIGKLYVPKEIIKKPTKLTAEEFEIIKMHPTAGMNLLRCIYPDISRDILLGILEHHERLDGSGYPSGITNITEFGRIIAVADTFEAFTSKRSYHKERSLEEGLDFMLNNEGLDPFYVNALASIVNNTIQEESMIVKDVAI